MKNYFENLIFPHMKIFNIVNCCAEIFIYRSFFSVCVGVCVDGIGKRERKYGRFVFYVCLLLLDTLSR